MKTTSYEISKMLLEADFKAKTDFYWAKWNEGDPELMHKRDGTPPLIEKVPAYDLETILETLPDSIHDKENCSSGESFELTKDYIQYSSTLTNFDYFSVDKQENESLADTAARMWLKLKKMGLV
jgi:hypothetical protein